MTRIQVRWLAVLASTLACTAPTSSLPTAELTPSDIEPAHRSEPLVVVAPLATPVEVQTPSTPPQPFLQLVPTPASERHYDADRCPWKLEHHGFPAIRADATVLVALETGQVGADDYGKEKLLLARYPASAEIPARRTSLIYDRSTEHQTAGPDACATAIALNELRVAALNAELREYEWRSLEPAELVLSSELIDPNINPALDHLRIAARPVEAYIVHDTLIVKVRGLEVIQRTPVPHLRVWRHDYADGAPHLVELSVDRVTGVALLGARGAMHRVASRRNFRRG